MNPSIELNGGIFQFFNAEPTTVGESNPLVWICCLFLILVILFLLQPLYLTRRLSAQRTAARSKNPSSKNPSLMHRFSQRARFKRHPDHHTSALIHRAIQTSPLKIDRLIITDRAILASCHQSHIDRAWDHDALETSSNSALNASPATAIVRFERSAAQFLHWAEHSQADVVIITGPKANLDLDAACRSSYQLQTQATEMVLINEAKNSSGFSAHSHSSSIETDFYHFLQDRLVHSENRSPLTAASFTEGTNADPTDADVYILLRSRLQQLMDLCHWSLEKEVRIEN